MKTNEIQNLPGSRLLALARPARRTDHRPGIKAAMLGLVCVIGVFGLLGLLYSVG